MWFRHLVGCPLFGDVAGIGQTWTRCPGGPRTWRSNFITQLEWEHMGIPSEDMKTRICCCCNYPSYVRAVCSYSVHLWAVSCCQKPCWTELLLWLLSIRRHFGFTSHTWSNPSWCCLLWRTTHQSLWWHHTSLCFFHATIVTPISWQRLKCHGTYRQIYNTIMSEQKKIKKNICKTTVSLVISHYTILTFLHLSCALLFYSLQQSHIVFLSGFLTVYFDQLFSLLLFFCAFFLPLFYRVQ